MIIIKCLAQILLPILITNINEIIHYVEFLFLKNNYFYFFLFIKKCFNIKNKIRNFRV